VLRDGFNFIAPHQRTGYGVAGANLLRALQRQGVPVEFFPMGAIDASLTDNPDLERALAAQSAFPTHAPSVRLSQALDLALHAGAGPRVGFPIFESEQFTPRELHHLRQQDALLVCTPWARDICRANGLTDMPIHIVPLGVDAAVYHPDVPAVRRGGETTFLQVGKLEPRKGQLELLRAFEAAFTPADDVRLVFACHNPFLSRDAFEAQLAPFRRSPMARRITLQISELPTSRDVATLMASADCGVFPARAEGWNLELVEMLAMAKPVIATYATAHTAYLTAENAQLITLGPPESARPAGFLGTWGSWGEAQHEQLVNALRAVHRARQNDTLGLNLAGLATARSLSWDNAAEAMLLALESLG
jgi:glycosyltransferase involved in cell wall biosynthesis